MRKGNRIVSRSVGGGGPNKGKAKPLRITKVRTNVLKLSDCNGITDQKTVFGMAFI
jgi:hypothetical protein